MDKFLCPILSSGMDTWQQQEQDKHITMTEAMVMDFDFEWSHVQWEERAAIIEWVHCCGISFY